MYQIWPMVDEPALRFSRLWFAEVAVRSPYEKVSFSWVASQVPGFKAICAWAEYVYSPEQRCKCPQRDGSNETVWLALLDEWKSGHCKEADDAHPERRTLGACCKKHFDASN